MKILKRLITILLILFIGAAVFGQSKGANRCGFRDPSTLENQVFNTSQEYLDLCTYSFWVDGNLYVVSYEFDPSEKYRDNNILRGEERKTRDIYLYRQDGETWIKASNLMKTDFWSWTDEYDMFYPSRRDQNGLIPDIGNSIIEVLSNGVVTIEVLNFYGDNFNDDFQHRWDKYLCIPQGNDTYEVTILSRVVRPNPEK